MAGGGRGFCVLKCPDRPGEPCSGFAGLAGWPVGSLMEGEGELAYLRRQARQIEAVLRSVRGRIEHLQAARHQEPIGV